MTADAIAFVAVGPDGIIRGADLDLDEQSREIFAAITRM